MRNFRRNLAVGVVLLATATWPTGAQSLADAAQRALEQREANRGKYVPSFTDADLNADPYQRHQEIFNVELSWPLMRRWLPIRTHILEAMLTDTTMARRVLAAVDEGSEGVNGVERGYGSEPLLVEVLRAGGMTPREYAAIELALALTSFTMTDPQLADVKRLGHMDANVDFIRRNEAALAVAFQPMNTLDDELRRRLGTR